MIRALPDDTTFKVVWERTPHQLGDITIRDSGGTVKEVLAASSVQLTNATRPDAISIEYTLSSPLDDGDQIELPAGAFTEVGGTLSAAQTSAVQSQNPVVLFGGQQDAEAWAANIAPYTEGIYPPLTAGANVEFAIQSVNDKNNSGTAIYPVTQANIDSGNVTAGMVAMANLWHHATGGHYLRVAAPTGPTVEDTAYDTLPEIMTGDDASVTDPNFFGSRKQVVDDASLQWNQEPYKRVIYNFWTDNEENLASDLLFFTGIDGATILDNSGIDQEWCLKDRQDRSGDRGLVDKFGPAKIDIFHGGFPEVTRNNHNSAYSGTTYDFTRTHNLNARLQREEIMQKIIDRDQELAFDAPGEYIDAAGTLLPGLTLTKVGDYVGGVLQPASTAITTSAVDIPAASSKYGKITYAQDLMFGILCSLGYTTPTKLDRYEASLDRTYVDLIFSIPAGTELTTHRIQEIARGNLPPVSVPRPHQQEVIGFTIDRYDESVERTPIWRSSETSYDSKYRGSVVIHDSGTNVPGGREAIVRVSLDEPIRHGDKITFGQNVDYGRFNLFGIDDFDELLFLDALRVYDPALDDGNNDFYYPGGPVIHGDVIDQVVTLETTMNVRRSQDTTTGHYLLGPELDPNVEAITMYAELSVDFIGSAGRFIPLFQTRTFGAQFGAFIANNSVNPRARLEDSTGAILFNGTLTPSASSDRPGLETTADTPFKMMISATQDDGTGNWKLNYWLNDNKGDELTGVTSGTGFFQQSDLEVLDSFGALNLGVIKLWIGDNASAFVSGNDMTQPAGAPTYEFQGDVDFWNGNALLPAGFTQNNGPVFTSYPGDIGVVDATVRRAFNSDQYIRGSAMPVDTKAITVLFEGGFSRLDDFANVPIFGYENNDIQLYMKSFGFDSIAMPSVSMKDSTGTFLVEEQEVGVFAPMGSKEIFRILFTATQDDGTGNWRLATYINDAKAPNEFSGPTSGTGFFRRNGNFKLFGDHTGTNTWNHMGKCQVWHGTNSDVFSTDGSTPLSPPDYSFEGDAAFWNQLFVNNGAFDWSTFNDTDDWIDI